MNIRSRKSNHRSTVSVHKALNEKDREFDYFIPLLKEKKSAIVANAINNLIHIFTFQGNRDQEISIELIEALCQIFTVPGKLDKPEELGKAISLACLNTGDNMEFYRYIKTTLSTIISDGEAHIKDAELMAAIYALSQACFYCCTDRDSYKHTIELFQEQLYTQKRKNIQDKLLSAWLLLMTRINPSEMVNYKMVLGRLIEFSKSSSQSIRLTASLAIAMIVDDVKEKVLDDFESESNESVDDIDDQDDEDYGSDYDYEDEEEEIERDYRKSNDNGKVSPTTSSLDNLSLGDQEADDDDEDEDGEEGSYSEYSEEDEINQFIVDDDHMVSVIEETLRLNDDKGKKKIQSKSLLRQILVNLKDGDSPKETIIIHGLPFHFSGWRKYIQLESLRKLAGSGLSAQWNINPLLQNQFGMEIPEGQRLRDMQNIQKRAISKSKKKEFDRDRRSTLFENNAAN